MHSLRVLIKEPTNTIIQFSLVEYSKLPTVLMTDTITKFDVNLVHFTPRYKPYWQQPALPEYV